MATYNATGFASLLTSVASAVNGDTIYLTGGSGSVTWTATADVTLTKSITVQLDPAITTLTIDLALAYRWDVVGQVSGSFILVDVPMASLLRVIRPISGRGCWELDSTSGALQLTAHGVAGENSPGHNGFHQAGSNVNVAYLFGCDSKNNGNDGYNNTGATQSMYCVGCSASGNVGQIASPHSSSLIDFDGTGSVTLTQPASSGYALFAAVTGGTMNLRNMPSLTHTPTTGSNASLQWFDNCTGVCDNVSVDKDQAGGSNVAVITVGLAGTAAGNVTFTSCSFTQRDDQSLMVANQGSTITAYDCTFTYAGPAVSSTRHLIINEASTNGVITLVRCVLDGSALTQPDTVQCNLMRWLGQGIVEGCLFKLSKTSSTGIHSGIRLETAANAKTIKNNTFYTNDTTGDRRGVWFTGGTWGAGVVTIRGNLFDNLKYDLNLNNNTTYVNVYRDNAASTENAHGPVAGTGSAAIYDGASSQSIKTGDLDLASDPPVYVSEPTDLRLTGPASALTLVTLDGYQIESYLLTLAASGQGTVSRTPASGGSETQPLAAGCYTSATTTRLLTATADTGYQFSGWSGDHSGTTNPDTVVMNQNRSVTGTFTQVSSGFASKYAGSGTQTGSGTDWVNPSNAVGAPDGVAAECFVPFTSSTSKYLTLTGFGFSIGPDRVIGGVRVTFTRKSEIRLSVRDNTVSLVVGGSVTGNNKASSTRWPTTWQAKAYGGASDKWGLTLTPAQVSASNFGVAISVETIIPAMAYVDSVLVEVWHALAGATGVYSTGVGEAPFEVTRANVIVRPVPIVE